MVDSPDNQLGRTPGTEQDPSAGTPAKPVAQNRLGLIAVATGIAVLLAGYLVWDAWAKQGLSKPVPVVLLCATTQCAYTETRPLHEGEILPVKCSKCGAQSLYTSMSCPKCQTRNVLNELRGLPAPSKCSKCGTELHYGG